MTTLLVLTLSHLAAALLAYACGKIAGAEAVGRGLAGPGEEVTGVQCRVCLRDVRSCRCPMAQRKGRV